MVGAGLQLSKRSTVWIQLELYPQEPMDVEIFALLGEMLFHRARHVGGVAQDDFAGFRREFWVLAHGVGDDGEGELVMFRDPVNGSGFAPGASQVLGNREIDFRAEHIVSEAGIEAPSWLEVDHTFAVDREELRDAVRRRFTPVRPLRTLDPVVS